MCSQVTVNGYQIFIPDCISIVFFLHIQAKICKLEHMKMKIHWARPPPSGWLTSAFSANDIVSCVNLIGYNGEVNKPKRPELCTGKVEAHGDVHRDVHIGCIYHPAGTSEILD